MNARGLDLTIDGLTVVYGGVTALDDVKINVPSGGFVTVLGANGAGKTTLVRSITGLLYLHKGRVRRGSIVLGGESILGKKSPDIVSAGVAQVPEGRKLFPNLTVKENLLCGAASRSDLSGIDDSLEQNLDLFPQLRPLLGQTAGLLSGGEQQMVAVGRALMSQPSLLICDELSLGLAPKIVHRLFELLTEINETRGTSILVIEQNASLALEHAADAYVLELGRVLMEGSAAELRGNPMVQELYLGGGGEAHTSYAAIERPSGGKRWGRKKAGGES
ncbi:ABC transporter ATP-binding protein [Candidatus Poriferisocius sp.]|uniref:ABC transporter ATP-binding protein n=1 Tax=Candidatus Poriferisocius sp. TaxID=3101276 RepID=UPI0013A98049|nr:ABC transporter ATP-binding protein [Acidimicrobiia bacterium]MYG58341.1 ABC transporter ATP-binding protein [Acidimicrobiia bacterium]MYJ34225.1 ABC transporter ATP-binding protein [Acidimicrobiia bacterium]